MPLNVILPFRLLRYLILLVAVYTVAKPVFAGDKDTWILVDTGAMTLTVLQDETVLRVYRNISIGRGGTTWVKKQRDGKTPLGEFHIVRMTTDTPFRRFFGIDYPDMRRAEQAWKAGTISQAQYEAIIQAIRTKRTPPQDTALGGSIGIHGIGEGNAAVHQDFNWTYGCIALTNAQIDDLANWVQEGMKVIIRH